MLSLNLVARAVIVHEGRLLMTVLNDGIRTPFHTLLGGHLDIRESLMQCVEREVREEVGLSVAPSRLLYVVENCFFRGSEKLHEIGFYFLCHPVLDMEGDFMDNLRSDPEELISPELVDPDTLEQLNFQPAGLRDVLAADLRSGFSETPKMLVLNELPGDVHMTAGVFRM
jgi:8-oxo-dGTP diphosphatase